MRKTIIMLVIGTLLLTYNECSDVYRHFADMQLPGVSVTYVRDKIINDTLRLPVTLLKANTDEGWEAIDEIFGYSLQIDKILAEPSLPDSVKSEFLEYFTSFYGYRANREAPEKVIEASKFKPDDVNVYIFHNQRCVTIYEPADTQTDREAVSSNAIGSLKDLNP